MRRLFVNAEGSRRFSFVQNITFSVFKKLFLGLLAYVLLASPVFAAMSDSDFIELCKRGSLQQITDAIKNGANVNALDKEEQTPLMWAAFKNMNSKVITALLKAGADVNAKNNKGSTPLMKAAGGNPNPEVITTLINAGADVNAIDNRGSTPLILAAGNADPVVVAAFIKAGANVNARNESGYTPLMQAVRYTRDSEAIKILLESGADPKAKDNYGKTVIDYAKKNEGLRNTNVLKMLEKAGR